MNNKKKKIIALVLAILILLSAAVIVFATVSATKNSKTKKQPQNVDEAIEMIKEKNTSFFGNIPDKTVFAVYGTNQNLSDVIFVGSFDKNKKTINIINVPRDTFVVLSDEYLESMSSKGHYAPSDGMKINAVHNYGGEDGNEYLTLVLQDLLDVDIDYYFEVNLDAFKEIVDAIDGVEIDVPQAMKYSDPTQDLYIDLQPGLQTLDGDKALQFVRFRKYPLADIQRIEMQKLFLKAFTEKLLSVKTLVTNAPELASILTKNTTTNLSLKEAVKYTQYIKDISADSLNMETLPGEIATPYIHNPEETRELVNRFFYDGEMPEELETSPASDSIKNNNDDSDYKEPVKHYYNTEEPDKDDDIQYEEHPIEYETDMITETSAEEETAEEETEIDNSEEFPVEDETSESIEPVTEAETTGEIKDAEIIIQEEIVNQPNEPETTAPLPETSEPEQNNQPEE